MGIEHDCILSKKGDITIVFRAELPEIFTLSDADYENLHHAWVKAIKALPKNSIMHKQDWFRKRNYSSETDEHSGFLNKAAHKHFRGRNFLEHESYVMLTCPPAKRKPSSSVFSSLLRPSVVPEECLSLKMLSDFNDAASQFKSILEDSKLISLKRLKADQLQSFSRRKGLIEKYCTLSEDDTSFLYKDILFKEDIQVGKQQARLYTLGIRQTCHISAGRGSLMISSPLIEQISRSVLPVRWDYYCPATTFVTSTFLLAMHRQP